MTRHRSLAIAALLTLASAAPLAAQIQDWQYQWYWGAKGGLISYSLPSGRANHPQIGGEWLITARRTALYVAYSTSFTKDGDTFTTSTGTTVPGFQVNKISKADICIHRGCAGGEQSRGRQGSGGPANLRTPRGT